MEKSAFADFGSASAALTLTTLAARLKMPVPETSCGGRGARVLLSNKARVFKLIEHRLFSMQRSEP